MSKGKAHALPVVLWSPGSVELYEPTTGVTKRATSLAALPRPSRPVILALGRRASFVRTMRLPNVPKDELGPVVALRLANVFPFPANELAFDLLLTSDVTAEGRLAIIGAARTADLRAIQEESKAAGITIALTVPAALGSAAVARNQGLQNAAVLEESAEGVSLELVADGHVHVSRILQSRGAAGLRAEVDRTFQANNLPCADVIAAGNFLFEHADRATSLSSLEALSREGLEFDLQLADQALLRRKRQESARTRLAALMVLSAVLLAAFYWDSRSRAELELKKGEARWQGLLKKERSIRDAEVSKVAKLQALDKSLRLAFSPAQSLADILAGLSNATPGNAWLTGLTLERGKPLQVRGAATESIGVKQFLERLNDNPRFREVRLSFANDAKIDETAVVQFSLSATAVGNLPLASAETKKKVAKR